ncbi:D-aminoacid aminotransferase-like PLP-dependent enzyme, partial [Glonium stellatum]
VVERAFDMHEVEEAVEEGRLLEAFSSGTAFFIAPVREICWRGRRLRVPMTEGDSGPYTKALKTWLGNIMWGKEQHEWGYVVDEE